jgi:hypothetical protein
MIESLKLFNVFGVATVRPGRVIVLAVSVRPNRKSVERSIRRDLAPIPGLDGVHQVLFGANLGTGRSPEIAVFQIQRSDSTDPNLFEVDEVRQAINETVELVRAAFEDK